MKKSYFLIGFRLTNAQRNALKQRGLHVYSTRSWDEGCGCTLEHKVYVNHEDDVITNWPALDDNNMKDMKDDFYKYMNKVGAESDYELYKANADIINESFEFRHRYNV